MKNDSNKVYVINDDSIWDYEDCSKVVEVAKTKEQAMKTFKKYVKQVKEELDFKNLDIITEEEAENGDDGYVVEDTNDNFSIYLNGDYNNNHTCISIVEKTLKKEKEMEL